MMSHPLTIKARLVVALSCMLSCVVAIGALGLYGMVEADRNTFAMYNNRTVPATELAEVHRHLSGVRGAMGTVVDRPTPESITKLADQVEEATRAAASAWKAYTGAELSSEERGIAVDTSAAIGTYTHSGLEATLDALRAGDHARARNLMVEVVRPSFKPVGAGIEKLTELQVKMARRAYEEAAERTRAFRYATLLAGLLGLVLSVGLSVRVIRSISVPLKRAVRVAQSIAAGDLSQPIEVTSHDEMAQLLDAMREMQHGVSTVVSRIRSVVSGAAHGDFSERVDLVGLGGFQRELAEEVNAFANAVETGLTELSGVLGAVAQGDLTRTIDGPCEGLYRRLKEDANATVVGLRRMVGDLKTSAGTIHDASYQIATGSTDLSQRTTSQAAALEESAASMEQLTATVKATAERAREANDLATGAARRAADGSEVVKQVVEAMLTIDRSSRRVADIVSVIDGIAFQTNILALNAAVEAARAGDQGRGFGVVANEVRTLAGRSADASREIRALIVTATNTVAAGTELVGNAGKKMEEMVESSQSVARIIGDIMTASHEQSEGIQQVNHTIAHMDELTQRNAALVDATSSSAAALEHEAASLASAISRFRLVAGEVDPSASSRSHGPASSDQAIPQRVGVAS